MKTLKESIEELITESYKFNNADEAIEAFKTKKLGVKISPNLLSKNAALIKNIFEKYYNKAQENSINEPTYGLQFIVAHATLPQDLDREIGSGTLYTYLQNYKKPWVKQLPSYNDFVNKPYNSNTWNDFESEIQSNLSKHGKLAKGTGDKRDVKILYPKDKDGWELKAAYSWAGAKAASFYGKEGEKEEPTKWCTRVSEEQYKYYSANGKYPLYIIRNYKTGKAYQISIGERKGYYDKEETLKIDFLDQNDKDGDEITSGDLSKIPDDLLKLIKGADLLKFKRMEAPNYKKTTYKQEIVSNDSIKKFYQKLDDLDDDYEMAYYGSTAEGIKDVYQDLVKKYGPVVKEISKNAFSNEKEFGTNKIYTNYIETGKKENSKIKVGVRIYHFKNLKNEIVKIENGKINHEFMEIEPSDYETVSIEKNILALIALLDSNLEVRFKNSRNKITYGSRFNRNEQTQERERKEKYSKIQKYIDDLINRKANDTEIKKILIVNSNFPEMTAWPNYEVDFKNGSLKIFRHFKGKNVYEQTFGSQKDMDKVTAEKLGDIINMANRYARKVFQSEIINSRKEHEYNTNMYEEVNEIVDNIFNY